VWVGPARPLCSGLVVRRFSRPHPFRGRGLEQIKRLEVGDIHIGRVLAHAGPDQDGTWPLRAVRDAIQRVASGELEDGFSTEIVNRRGVTNRGLLDGGEQERAQARSWSEKADAIRDSGPRVAATLDRVAQSYESLSRRFDGEG
jgi:hypothetical protein